MREYLYTLETYKTDRDHVQCYLHIADDRYTECDNIALGTAIGDCEEPSRSLAEIMTLAEVNIETGNTVYEGTCMVYRGPRVSYSYNHSSSLSGPDWKAPNSA